MRFIVFLDVAFRQCFFEIASPSRACCPPLSRQSTVNQRSRLRFAFSNTRPNAAALSNRLWRRNRNNALRDLLGSNPEGGCAAGGVGAAYGVSFARPLARRRLRTSRPALVAIRARKPCVRARFRLLG